MRVRAPVALPLLFVSLVSGALWAQEREIPLEPGDPGLSHGPAFEVAGVRLSGFFVGSANYNSRIQMVPEFAGSAPVSSEPTRIDFRFDQFAIGAYKTFASWLSAGASIEIERHAHRHSHGFFYPPVAPPGNSGFGCPGTDTCVEQFGGEPITTEVSL